MPGAVVALRFIAKNTDSAKAAHCRCFLAQAYVSRARRMFGGAPLPAQHIRARSDTDAAEKLIYLRTDDVHQRLVVAEVLASREDAGRFPRG